MRAIINNDASRGPGHGIIHLEVGDSPLPSMPQGLAFTLQRSSDGLFLAQNGWQESHAEHAPDRVQRQDTHLELAVGPHVVDNLDSLDSYRLHLRHTSLSPCMLQVEALNYSPLRGQEGVFIASPLAAQAPPAAPPEPVQEPAEALPLPEEDPSTQGPQTLSMDAEPAPAAAASRPWLIPCVALLLLALVGAGAFYWYQQQQPVAEQNTPPVEQPAAPQTDADKDAQKAKESADKAAASSPDKATPVAPVPALSQARTHLQGSADPAQSLALARSLQQQADAGTDTAAQKADAVFLLVEDAAQKGNAEAMFLLGSYFDPVDKAPKGSIQSDPQQALRWYNQAKSAGQSAVDPALTALRDWAEKAAAQGNQEARTLLQNWK